MTDGVYTYYGEWWAMYIIVESLCCTPKNVTLYANCISIIKNKPGPKPFFFLHDLYAQNTLDVWRSWNILHFFTSGFFFFFLPQMFFLSVCSLVSFKWVLPGSPTVSHATSTLTEQQLECLPALQDLGVRWLSPRKDCKALKGKDSVLPRLETCLTHISSSPMVWEVLVNIEAVTSGSVLFVVTFYVTSQMNNF